MEVFIPIVIILFVFSLISERIANFLKLNLPEGPEEKKLFGIFPGGPFRTKSNDEYCEKIRERRVFWLAFISGLIVSFASKANLFSMLRFMEHANQTLWWNGEHNDIGDFKESGLEIFAGCFLTSLFISLGSKFWHDLLDLLLYTKNLKEKLADPRTYEAETTEQLVEFIETPEYKLAQLALEQHEVRIKAIPGVFTIGAGYIKTKRRKIGCIEVHVDNFNTASKIPSNVSFRIKSGKDIDVPVNIIVTGTFPSTNSLSSGGGIANQDKALGWGTAGAIVKDIVTKQLYILSCFHVLQGRGDWKSLSGNRNIVIHENNVDVKVGELKYGYRTDELDVGLAKIEPGISYSNTFVSQSSEIREVKTSDAMRETGVRILGAKTQQVVFGFVYNESWSATFKYPDGSVWNLKDLFVLSRINEQNQLQCMSKGGDSGAIVIAEDNHILGMVVGADSAFTYAIKMDKIAKNFDVEFI